MSSRSSPHRAPWVGAWLLILCALVVAMILVGGATRLTDSGLSITEWDLSKGLTPPLTDARWAEEFALYQRTTEYQVQNRGMSLAQFQHIYWWEWGHRFLGKMIGIVFAIPFLVFWTQGRLNGRFWPILGFGALGGMQGAVGWWMVVSGLEGRLDVSPIRLAVHLGLAFLILAVGVRLAIHAFAPAPRTGPGALVWVLAGAVLVQTLLGALMAGADAGAAFADWPTIGGVWLPAFADGPLLENPAALQFFHRTAGYAIVFIALAAAWRAPQPLRGAAMLAAALTVAQAMLGIAVVMTGARLTLSLTHQAGAVALWLAIVSLTAGRSMR